MIRALVCTLATIGLIGVGATAARADVAKCQRDTAKASAKYVQGRTKALQKCEDAKVKDSLPAATDCMSEPKTALLVGPAGTLASKLRGSIAKSCGGDDKTCGTGDDIPVHAGGAGWPSNCPDFEDNQCLNPINDCDDIVTCLECLDNAAVDEAIDLYYGSLQQGSFGANDTVNKCQQAIGKATAKYLGARSKALQKCQDGRLKGLYGTTCPVDSTGKTALILDKAETKKITTICKACGGEDKLCDGDGDVSVASIGFPEVCPYGRPFDGAPSTCSGAISTTADLATCVDCVTEFKADCMDQVAVPEFGPLDPRCNPNATTTTTSTSTSSTTSSSTSSRPRARPRRRRPAVPRPLRRAPRRPRPAAQRHRRAAARRRADRRRRRPRPARVRRRRRPRRRRAAARARRPRRRRSRPAAATAHRSAPARRATTGTTTTTMPVPPTAGSMRAPRSRGRRVSAS